MKEIIIQSVLTGAVLFMLIAVGYVVIDRMGEHYWIAVGFCIDKEGMHNISDYGYEFNDYAEQVNCSNKENPVVVDTALS